MKKINGQQQKSSEKVLKKVVNKESSGGVIQIENTPFKIVTNNIEARALIVLGNEVVKKCNNENEARKTIENKDWDLILNAGVIYMQYIVEQRAKESLEKMERIQNRMKQTGK